MTMAGPGADKSAELEALASAAAEHHRAGRLAEAEAAYRQIQVVRPGIAEIHNNLGALLIALGRPDEAMREFEQAVALKPELSAAHNGLGNVLRQSGQWARARAHFQQAIAGRPDWTQPIYGLGVVLAAQGELAAARAQFERVVALRPDFADAYYNLGCLAQTEGNLPAAQMRYEQAIAIAPNSAEAHNNLGNVLRGLGKFDAAMRCVRRAVEIDPKHAIARNNLGCLWQQAGDLDAAKAAFEQVIAIAPDYAEAHNNLGNVLGRLGKPDEALVHYERAVALRPDLVEPQTNLGAALILKGEFTRALACIRRALEIRPDFTGAVYHLAELKTFAPQDPELDALEALVERSAGRSVPDRLHLHFALGKALDDAGEYHKAFQHWIEANRLKRGLVQYDADGHERLCRRVAEVFDSALFERLGAGGDPSELPIFILGMPRSGSSLVEQILASHARVHAAGELPNFNRLARSATDASGQIVPFPDYVPTLTAEERQRLGEAYLAGLPPVAADKTRLTDKFPANFLCVGLIRLVLPGARIIHTLRNPLDTCVSCYSKLFETGQAYSYDLSELGRHYRAYETLMAHWRTVLPAGAVLDVSYEELVADLEGQARRLVEFCGLEWDERCLNFHETKRPVTTGSKLQVRRPLYRGAVERWRRYEPFLGPLIAALGRET